MRLEESAAASIAEGEGEAVYVEPSSWEEEGEWMMVAIGYYERGVCVYVDVDVYVDEAD